MGNFMKMSYETKRSTRIFTIALCLVLLLSTFIAPLSGIEFTASAGQTISGSKSFNNISYKVYVPSSYSASNPMPAIVSMHGCMQDMSSFGTTTRIDTYAEKEGFIVIHVQQSSSNNSSSCFNWFESGDQKRGSGEPKDIVDIINFVNQSYKIDFDNIFAYGFSAGGGMSPVLAATYPDVFKAIGIGSGLPFKAATTMTDAFTVMMSGTSLSADTLAGYIVSSMGSYKRPVPVIIFQGSSDYTVIPKNAELLASSWLIANNKMGANINTTPTTSKETTSAGKSFTRTVYTDANGRRMIETLLVDGMGHAWSGGDGYNFSEPNGPNATEYMINFFKQFIGDQANIQVPVTTASPTSGTYTSAVTVTLTTDIPATTYYTTNGTNPTTSSNIYTGPFTVSQSSTIKFFSVSDEGGTEAVKSVSYTINIPEKDTTPPTTTHSPAAGVYYETINVSLSVNENATTYYTTDGSTPTTSSKKYTGPISVSSDSTIKYFSVDASGNVENVKTASYIVITDSAEGKYESVTVNGIEQNLYISGKYRSGYSMPLVVMLHGDGQTPAQFAATTGMNKLADEKGFLVLYVKSSSSNPINAWSWYTTATQTGGGDAAYVAQAIRTVIGKYYINSDKIYTLGFGSGGAMANVVAATNPSLIAAVGIVSGTSFGSASNINEAEILKALGSAVSGDVITSAMGASKKAIPVIVFHGANDNVFASNNASHIIAQWATANDNADNGVADGSIDGAADATLTATSNGLSYTKESYKNANGDIVMEKYTVHGLGYAWSGGKLGGNYASTSGPDASAIIYDFFKNSENIDMDVPVIEDKTAPITTPTPDSGTYLDNVTVSLIVNEQATIYYTTNGTTPTTSSAVYTGPLTFTSDTTLKFFSVDNAGNKEAVKTCTYTINSSSVVTEELSYDASNSGYAGYIYNFGAGSELKAGLGGYYLGDSVRAFIAFNNSIPVSSIKSVVLRLTVGSYNEAVTGLSLDVKNGYFGDAEGVIQTDFNKAADATSIASATPKSSGAIDFEIPSSAYQYLDGHVEFRVCTTVTNGLNEACMTFSNAKLIITYDRGSTATYALSRAVTLAADDNVTFADSALKNAIINAGIDTNNDGNISVSEISNLYGLDASKLTIRNITGLEYASNLRYLDLSSNSIEDISPLSGCTSLRYINISGNKISSINSINADNLYMLIAIGNTIEDISALTGLNYLDTVSFAGNKVADISALRGLTSLRTLDFTSCSIEDISTLSTLTYVNHLYFSSNKIASTDAINSLKYIIEKNFDAQHQPQPDNNIISVTTTKSGYNVIFKVTTLAGVSRVSVAGNGSTHVSTQPVSSTADTSVWEITILAPSHTITYIVDAYVNGSFAGENYEIEVTVGQDNDEESSIKSVEYVVAGEEVIFTVTASSTINRVKVTTADALSSYIAYSSNYTVNPDGDYVFTIKVSAIVGTTNYAFDGRSNETGKYTKLFFYKSVTVSTTTTPDSEAVLSVTHEFNKDKIIFTVITSTNDYNRIKITLADDLSGSLGVGKTYAIDENGKYVWTIKITAPTSNTSYAFDAQSASTGKYLKDYFFYDVTIPTEPENVIKSISHEFVDEKIIFTITTSAGDYNRIKVTTSDNLSGSLGVGNYTIDTNGDYVWTVKTAAPSESTSYAFDLRSSVTGKYLKEYFVYNVDVIEDVAHPIKAITHTISDGKIIFTITTAAGSFNRIKITTDDNLGGSLGVGNYTVAANGDYVWTVKITAPSEDTSYAFDLRSSETGKYRKDYFYYDVELESSFVKSVNYTIADGKIIFTVVTKPESFSRLKLTTADDLSGSLAVSKTYTVDANGDYVWIIKEDMPTETTTYAIDARSAATEKYIKNYYIFTVTL